MAWLFLVILLVIAWVVVSGLALSSGTDAAEKTGGVVLATIVALLLIGGITAAFSIRSVGAGHVGLLKDSAGTYTGQVGEGWHFIHPMNTIQVVSVQNREFRASSKCYDATWDRCLDAFTKDNNDVFVIATMNFHIDPDNVQSLYRTYPNFEKTIMESRFAQVVKDETVKYTAEEIAPNRENIRLAVRARLVEELAKYSISADDFFMPNIEFRNELKAKFEEKAAADQTTQTQQRLVAAEQAKAEQRAAQAKGEADAIVNLAKGQAEANNLVAASLTPALIQFQMVQKLADNISVMMLPSGGNTLIDVSRLLPQSE